MADTSSIAWDLTGGALKAKSMFNLDLALRLVGLVRACQGWSTPKIDLPLPAVLQIVPNLGEGKGLLPLVQLDVAMDPLDHRHVFVLRGHDAAC
jgi:hypothetical protein